MEVNNKVSGSAAVAFMRTAAANVDNRELSDDQFRLMVLNCLTAINRVYPDDNRQVNTPAQA